jgi:hypothetical protein
VKYLLLVVGLRWRWACGRGWLWVIIWAIVTTIGCSWVIATILILVSACGTWIGTVSSCGIPIVAACDLRVVLRQLHGLLLGVSVHRASFRTAVVVIIVVLEYHVLGHRLLGLLQIGHFLQMMDQMRRSTGALVGGLLISDHL